MLQIGQANRESEIYREPYHKDMPSFSSTLSRVPLCSASDSHAIPLIINDKYPLNISTDP